MEDLLEAMGDLAVSFVLVLEGRMENIDVIKAMDDVMNQRHSPYEVEVGEEDNPSDAYLFEGTGVSAIDGSSSSLHARGFIPFPQMHLNTKFALDLTQALARVHASSLILQERQASAPSAESQDDDKPLLLKCDSKEEIADSFDEELTSDILTNEGKADSWTQQISKPRVVGSNLRIIVENFKQEGIISRVTDKLDALQTDVETISQFVHFAAALQTESRIQSVGPICMCDVWIHKDASLDGTQEDMPLVVRKRGGRNLQAPPLRDIAWIWLTLLRPEILREYYIDLCEAYCSSFNDVLQKEVTSHVIPELTLFDIMKDLGENFLHGFLTMVHKFVVSGTWSLDRQLHTRQGVVAFSDSIAFLVDNGIVGSIFIA